MAQADPQGSFLNPLQPAEGDAEERRQARIERIFAELAQELGITNNEMLQGGLGAGASSPAREECTVVYDKFSARHR